MTFSKAWSLNQILGATGGKAVSVSCPDKFMCIRIDSRIIQPGDVFVAIKGERFDGHDFIDEVVGKRAGCVIVREDACLSGGAGHGHVEGPVYDPRFFEDHGTCCVAVPDTLSALGDLAACLRREAGIPVVAITGSTGKTTTREMTTAICRRQFETLSTYGNFNNEVGLPLTLFRLTPEHRLAVLELGMNHPGEIRRLSAICTPDIGVITNIGPAHLEGLKDVASVAKAKGELLENIRPNGVAVLNADDEFSRQLKENANNPVVTFGTSPDAGVRGENIASRGGKMSFTLVLPDVRTEINLNVYGAFMVKNALAAAAGAHSVGIGPENIKAGLETFRAVEGRMMIYETPEGVYIIDDTYNANPMSMEAAIDALKGLTGTKRGILVAGDMMELGDASRHYHERIGRTAANAHVTRLYLTGSYAAQVAHGAKSAGMESGDIFVGTKTDIVKDLSGWLRKGDWVLVKGSRSTGMEEIVRQMAKDARVRSAGHLETEEPGK